MGGGVRQSSRSEDSGGRGVRGGGDPPGEAAGSGRASPTELLRAARGPLTSEPTVSLLQALCARTSGADCEAPARRWSGSEPPL